LQNINALQLHHTQESPMRTATLPAVRVSPDTRSLIESVLREGESLSTFIEQTAKQQAMQRIEDDAFYARGLAAAKRVDAGGKTYTLDEVMASLRERSAKKRLALANQAKPLKKAA
jgi:uncharacterized protein (DUF1778 family)